MIGPTWFTWHRETFTHCGRFAKGVYYYCDKSQQKLKDLRCLHNQRDNFNRLSNDTKLLKNDLLLLKIIGKDGVFFLYLSLYFIGYFAPDLKISPGRHKVSFVVMRYYSLLLHMDPGVMRNNPINISIVICVLQWAVLAYTQPFVPFGRLPKTYQCGWTPLVQLVAH